MLKTLTKTHFEALLQQRFDLSTSEARLPLTLTEVSAGRGAHTAREPFSLLFEGPAEPVLAQAIYPLENAELGKLDIFLVPVGRASTGQILYEAVFN